MCLNFSLTMFIKLSDILGRTRCVKKRIEDINNREHFLNFICT